MGTFHAKKGALKRWKLKAIFGRDLDPSQITITVGSTSQKKIAGEKSRLENIPFQFGKCGVVPISEPLEVPAI